MSDNELAIYVDWPGFKEGTREANDSILRGQFVFYSYGLEIITEPQPKYYKRYDEFLAKNGVYIQNQGCELDNSGKAQGRNHTIALAVLKHYGADFWQRADSYARQSK